jgi:hypothetical protein
MFCLHSLFCKKQAAEIDGLFIPDAIFFLGLLRVHLFEMIGQCIGNVILPQGYDLGLWIVMAAKCLEDNCAIHAGCQHTVRGFLPHVQATNQLGVAAGAQTDQVTNISIPEFCWIAKRFGIVGAAEQGVAGIQPVNRIVKGIEIGVIARPVTLEFNTALV